MVFHKGTAVQCMQIAAIKLKFPFFPTATTVAHFNFKIELLVRWLNDYNNKIYREIWECM